VRIELQRLVFEYGLEKKLRRLPGLFFASFLGFLRVVLRKEAFWTWCFDGEVVVICVVEMVF